MTVFFCPNCWREITSEARTCDRCGYDLDRYAALSYEEKLLLALHHPIRENRMMAVETLGRLRSEAALPEWERLLADDDEDFYLLSAVLRALAHLGTPEAVALLRAATHHPSALIRSAARDLISGS